MTKGIAIAGWAADRSSSRKTVFLAGLGLALLATILYCLGRAPWVLVIARAVQGFSASIIYTAGLALIADTVSPDEVGSWYVRSPAPPPLPPTQGLRTLTF